MTESEQGRGNNLPVRDVPIDWESLEDAFENNAPEVHSYLHLVSGEVLRVVDGIADPEMHARIASDAAYLRIEPVSSREQYRWMERFIPMVDEPVLRGQLSQAIDGKGAFRRFKDVLIGFTTERERWFAFRSERLRVFMEAWLAAHALHAVPRPTFPQDASSPRASTGIAPEALTRRKGVDALRQQLREVVEGLGSRDLEKVIAFAEFVKARRAARGFAVRPDAQANAGDEASEKASSEEPPTDIDPPSSQQRTAAR
jgi:ribosomal protein L12E/L44/L45/RPP1/RPP2